MSADTAERSLAIVRRFMNAAGPQNRAERSSLMHDELVVSTAGGLPFSGEYHGPQGFFLLLGKMNEVFELTPGPIALQPLSDNMVAARFRLTFVARSSGCSAEMRLIEIYTVREGLIVELDVYYKDPSAVAALLAPQRSAARPEGG